MGTETSREDLIIGAMAAKQLHGRHRPPRGVDRRVARIYRESNPLGPDYVPVEERTGQLPPRRRR